MLVTNFCVKGIWRVVNDYTCIAVFGPLIGVANIISDDNRLVISFYDLRLSRQIHPMTVSISINEENYRKIQELVTLLSLVLSQKKHCPRCLKKLEILIPRDKNQFPYLGHYSGMISNCKYKIELHTLKEVYEEFEWLNNKEVSSLCKKTAFVKNS